MSYSDDVRSYCVNHYIIPTRRKGLNQIIIRAGDIHEELGFQNRLPLVCSALGSNKFEELATVKRISITGPVNGANTIFTFQIIS